MPVDTKTASKFRAGLRGLLLFVICLLATLCVLFHRSFESDQVLFSNDGPLGANRSQAEYALSNFLGYWQDLNWLGMESPGLSLDASGLMLASFCKLSPDFGPVLFAKIYAPVGVFLLGVGAWCFFRQLQFRPWVCVLGGLAAALNTTAFSPACWGLATWPLAWAMNLFALAILAAPSRQWVLKTALAGLAVGLGVMEGFDVGAIFSLFTAAFAFLSVMATRETLGKRIATGAATIAIMAVCAGLIAAQTVSSLISTQVKGVAGMAQDEQTKQRRWDQATQWSLPKAETLRVIIPGLFGYRMPELYGDPVPSAGGSNYWGASGQTPGIIQSRHSGMGIYAGVLVVLVAVWGVTQSFQKKGSALRSEERKQIWCWLTLLVVSILLAWGRHAPFYRVAYALPYLSTIRNPIKFIFPFSLALVILFGYGLEGLARLYLDKTRSQARGWRDQVKGWWKTAPVFDRKWTIGLLGTVPASLLGWLIYASSKAEIVRYLQQAGFPEQQYPQLADSIAQFSLNEVGLFIFFLILSVGLVTLMLSGFFAGPRARWAGIALGLLLVMDLGRANTPWIVYWNYKQKYASNPIIDLLRERPQEHRVAGELAPLTRSYLVNDRGQNFAALYGYEWLQHLFQYYRVQSLDVIQMPRQPEFDSAYLANFSPLNQTERGLALDESRLHLCARLWQLTNARYVLGMTGFLQLLNTQIDPVQQRFRIHTRFEVVPKHGVTVPTKPEHLTAVTDTNGPFALFEFTGALPRAKLFASWQVSTNDNDTLQRLKSPDFDPSRTVLVANELAGANAAGSTNHPAGTVEFAGYQPKSVQLNADTAAPAVLLLNDRFHPDWKVLVNGKPETLLRCNYIMRGVYLTPGKHVVEFRFAPATTAFYVSLGSLIAGVALCGFLAVSSRRPESPPTATKPAGKN